jgi:hypothetical protein
MGETSNPFRPGQTKPYGRVDRTVSAGTTSGDGSMVIFRQTVWTSMVRMCQREESRQLRLGGGLGPRQNGGPTRKDGLRTPKIVSTNLSGVNAFGRHA